jgi:hypothetical protein
MPALDVWTDESLIVSNYQLPHSNCQLQKTAKTDRLQKLGLMSGGVSGFDEGQVCWI